MASVLNKLYVRYFKFVCSLQRHLDCQFMLVVLLLRLHTQFFVRTTFLCNLIQTTRFKNWRISFRQIHPGFFHGTLSEISDKQAYDIKTTTSHPRVVDNHPIELPHPSAVILTSLYIKRRFLLGGKTTAVSKNGSDILYLKRLQRNENSKCRSS